MKQIQLLLVLAFLAIKLVVTAQTKLPECNTGVPHFNIDLSSDPDSMYITPNVVRTEQCCGSPNSNDNYVSFYVKAHPDVAMIEVDIYSGANPPGDAAKYNVITGGDAITPGVCGADINAGSPTCVTLDPSGYLKVTYYKPGSNKNQYYFKQIPKPIYPNDDTTRVGCSLPLNIYGLDNVVITSINSSTGNTTLGAYNSLLSCTNCSTPMFSPGLSTPAWIDYQICGSPQAAACGTYASCDTVRLYTFGELALSVNPNPASFCSGGGGVTLTATATGGDGNYTYKWKDSFGVVVSTSNVYNATSAGTFTAEVADGLTTILCPVEYVSVPVTIGNPPVVNAGLDQTLCATSPSVLLSGSIQYATGGSWTGGNGTFSPAADSLLTVYSPTAAEISAGSVTLTLTSTGAGGGCVNDSDKVIITFSDTIFVNPSAAPIVCNGDVTTISANATGGTAPLTYVWSNGATSSSISASAGTYSVMVRDVLGCVATSSITVVDPAPITLTLSSTNVSTDPSCDGSASVIISGGLAPYSVLWSNSETTLTTSNTLCYGITTVTVTDANGCVVTGSVVVNNPSCSGFNVTATSSDVDCYGGTNGAATVFPVGGTPTYTYLWNSTPNQTTQSASNLPAGNYTVTVTDDLGCVDVAGVTISQPTIITNTITHTDVTTIGGSDGSATANPQGGTPNYSYLWTPGGQTTQTASNLSSAVGGLTYYLTITDDNSCTYNDSVLVNQPPCNNFILSVNTTDVTCNGLSDGSAYMVIAHGTPPYNIVWSHGPTNVTSVTGLSQGVYSVTVTDASNCTTFQNFTITEPAPLSLSLVPTNVVCNDDKNGTIDLSVAGGTFPYKYTWKLGTTTIANHEDLVNLAPGTYSVTVTDDNKCTVTGSIGITQPNKLDATAIVVDNTCYGTTNASIDMTPTGGMLPYNYTWTGPSGFTSSSEDISNLNVGLYEFSFTDGNGCQSQIYQSYVNQPDTVLIANIDVPCPTPGASTVTVNVDSIIGGNGGPYQISFDNQVTYQATGVYTYSLNVGATYQVWARDTNGCTSISPYTLSIDTNVAVASVNFNTCIPFGSTTIPVTINPTGGNGGPYQVSTDGGTTWTAVGTYLVNLAVNATHNVIVRDTNNCVSINYSFYIPAEISSNITMTSEVSCLGFNDGALDLTVNGGVPNYNFAWTGPSSYTSSSEDLSGLFAGMYYVTITDDEGCVKLDSIEITTVLDTINPTITCIGNQTVNTSSTTCDYTVSGIAWDAVATDNCVVSNLSFSLSGATTGTGSTLNNVAFNLGTTTVIWTATDSLGNSVTCTYTITVIDNIDPSIVACGAGSQTVNVDAGQCTYTQTANVWDATATDNCTVSTITADLSGATTATGLTTLNGVSFNTGVTTVLWTVTDTVGNSVTCTYTITVIDNIDPSIVACGAGNQTVNVDAGQCTYTQTANVWDATATDNCTVDSIYYTLSGATSGTGTTLNGVSFNTGVTTVLWTVTDTVGNSVTCTYTITVIDNIDPSIVACGAGNQTVNVDAGQCTYTQTANVWDATATDNCTVDSIYYTLSGATSGTGTTLNGVSFNTGVTTVLWTVTDTVGNSVTCTYTITVIDNIDPSIVACGAGSQTVNVDAGQCTYTQTANVWDATATDNCTVSTITADLSGATTATGLTTLNGVSFNTGVTTVLWIVTDTVGNSVTCTYTITVIDNIDPSIVACGAGSQTVNVDAGQCTYTQTANVWDATATDNCTVSTITADLSGATTATGLTTLNGVSFNTGVTTVLWIVTDTVGNSVTCTYTITVIDNIDPSIVACGAGSQTVNVDAGQCTYTQTANVWDATATDNCTVSTITADLSGATTATGLTTLNGVSFNTGVTTVLWTVTDTVGNSVTCTYTITVIDNIDPSIVACGAGSQTVNVDAGQCTYTQTANVWDATATDNCTVSTITADLSGATTATGLTTLNGVSFNTGVTTVLWIVTDTVGNSVTCTYTITVIDNIDPSIVACGAGSQTVNVDAGQCTYTQTANVWDATATDNCTVSTITADLSGATTATGLTTLNGVSFNTGVTTVLWTVTDTVGNSVTCTYTITVIDNIDPSIVACGAGNQTVNVDAGQCTYTQTANVWDATATDNCTVSTITADLSGATTATGLTTLNGVSFNTGVTTVLWTVTDTVGNSVTCTYTITVIDNIDPSIVACGAGNQTVNVDAGQCTYTQTANVWDATATDNCTVSTITADLSGATTATGLTTLNGVSFNTGVTTVLWTVTDTVGNSVTCTYTITVIDNIDPSIVACGAGSQTVNVDAGQCTYTQTANVWDATATDNCTVSTITADLSGATTATGLTTLNGVSFNTGVTTVLWTVTDTVGNSVTCTYTITVIDNIDPSIVACGAGNQTVNVDAGQCTYTQTANVWDATATDNCTVSTITADLSGATTATGLTTLNGVSFNTGVTTVLWTVTDTVGNSVTCTYTITVIDNIDPSIVACGAGSQTVNVDAGQCTYTQTANVWDATATDNCTVSTITADLSGATTATGLTTLNGVSFNTGVTTVLWTVTDTVGNSVTCTYTITVIDNIDPSIVACGAGSQTVNVDAGQCTYTQTANVWDATATDNCTVSTITADLSGATTATGLTTLNGVSFNTGVTTVLWTVTDTVGNSVTCTYTITVIDNIDPSIVACGAGNQTVNVDAGQCTYTQTANVWDATATDNCTVSTITADLSGATTATGLTTLNGVSFNTGVTTVLWTVTDTVGNSVTCTYTITVIDNIDPSIIACGAGSQVMAADSGVCTYTHTDNTWDATATDNCTIDSIYYTLSGATLGTGTTLNGVTFNNGITTVLWTVTDTVGNTVTCSYTVDVLDTEAPIISNCPTNITVSNDSSVCGAVVTWTPPTFTDNCGAIMTSTHNPGDSFIVGNTTVTYTVTDSAGNVSTCTFNVIVNDTELPIITCSPQIASCDSLVNFNAPTATDNCGILSVTQIAGLPSGSTFPVGTTTNTFEVIDIHNNVAQCSFDVVIHPTPIISSVSTDVSCFGLNDGSIDITVTNGTTPYTYAWSNSAITEDLANLAPGIYSVTVTDSNSCTATAQDTISEPALLTIVATDSNVTCFGGSNGAIDITVAGGIAPYTYLWNTNDTIADLSNLSVGYYEVTVTDSNGCTVSYSTTITSPDSIAIQTTANNATCLGANGSVQTQVIGGVMPYSYAWSNGDTTLNLNNVVAGVYTLVVTDANGCTAQITDTVNSVSNLVVELATEDVSCYGKADGEIRVITTSGNPPYTYNWSTGDSTSVASGLDIGGYYVIVTDSFGCQDSLFATIYQPDSLVVELDAYEYPSGTNISLYGGEDGSIVSMTFGGTSPYEYLWSTGDTTADINDLKAGEYSVIVTDENGCTGFAKIILIQPNVLEMPNGYSPNGDGSNDFFVIKGVEAYPDNEIVVFNRWGNIVYEGKNYNNEWNGGNKSGEDLPDGTYFVIFKVLSPEEITLQGYVDLRRK